MIERINVILILLLLILWQVILRRYAKKTAERMRYFFDQGEYDKLLAEAWKLQIFHYVYKMPKDFELFCRGFKYQKEGKTDRAIECFSKAIKINPACPAVVYNWRGYLLQEKGETDKAIADYTQSIELAPQQAYPYDRRGVAYEKKGSHDLAMADFNKAIEIDPSDAQVYYDRAESLFNQDKKDECIADLTKVIELDSQHELSADTYTIRGLAYMWKNENGPAFADFDQAIRFDPNNPVAYFGRGCARPESELDESIKDFTRAIELKPDYDSAYYERALVYFEKGEFQKSDADVRKAQELHCDNIDPEFLEELKQALAK